MAFEQFETNHETHSEHELLAHIENGQAKSKWTQHNNRALLVGYNTKPKRPTGMDVRFQTIFRALNSSVGSNTDVVTFSLSDQKSGSKLSDILESDGGAFSFAIIHFWCWDNDIW
jgi:hypothetical protein